MAQGDRVAEASGPEAPGPHAVGGDSGKPRGRAMSTSAPQALSA